MQKNNYLILFFGLTRIIFVEPIKGFLAKNGVRRKAEKE